MYEIWDKKQIPTTVLVFKVKKYKHYLFSMITVIENFTWDEMCIHEKCVYMYIEKNLDTGQIVFNNKYCVTVHYNQ